jgi:hypothetical protein
MAAMGHRLETLFTSALAIGLRSGECSALHWTDIDLDKAAVTVRHMLQGENWRTRKRDSLRCFSPKSKKSRRAIALPAVCVPACPSNAFTTYTTRACRSQAQGGPLKVIATSSGNQTFGSRRICTGSLLPALLPRRSDEGRIRL